MNLADIKVEVVYDWPADTVAFDPKIVASLKAKLERDFLAAVFGGYPPPTAGTLHYHELVPPKRWGAFITDACVT